jgi:hypothetical protein
MRHPHPLISLLSLMLLCSIRATSHEQPLDDLPLSSRSAIDANYCSLRSLTAYFRNLVVQSLTDYI